MNTNMQVMTLEEICCNSDWAEAFGDESSGNTDKTVEAFGEVSDAPFGRADVEEVFANGIEFGDCAETECFGVFRLKDGRFAAVTASCDTTGWDCQAGNTMTVGETLEDVIRLGLEQSHREKLKDQLEAVLGDEMARIL
jgi:hypothetical protein